MNLSLDYSCSWINSGSWVTPIGLEMLSPSDLLMASPWISWSKVKYFGWEARLFEVQHDFHVNPWNNVLFLLSSRFFSFISLLKAYDLLKDEWFPNFFCQLNISEYTLSSKNSSWISYIGTSQQTCFFKHDSNEGWSTGIGIKIFNRK